MIDMKFDRFENDTMRTLIVYAHPEPLSFNGALKNRAFDTLQQCGHTVEVSDLYAMNFKAAADGDDFPARANPGRLDYPFEQFAAHDSRRTDPAIAAEQEKLRRAHLVLFQFPLWWYSTPAILKGWFERVLSAGFAFGPGRLFDRAGMAGTRAMLSFTTNGLESSYRADGWHGSIDATCTPLHQGLRFIGFDVLPPFVAYNVVRCTDAERHTILRAFGNRLRCIADEEPLAFLPMSAYDETGRQHR